MLIMVAGILGGIISRAGMDGYQADPTAGVLFGLRCILFALGMVISILAYRR